MNQLISVFKSGKDTLSMKRTCAFSGWLVILFSYLYAVFNNQPIPEMGELIAAVVVLLGVEPVTEAFKRRSDDSTIHG